MRFNLMTRFIILTGIVLFLILLAIPAPSGLSSEGKKALAIFILCLTFWVTGYLPLAVTSVMGIALIPLLDVLSPFETYAIFGNEAIFFILGALMLAAALYKTGLGTRIAYRLIVKFGYKPYRIIGGIIMSSALLSFIMPEHAVAAMLFPVVFEIVENLELKPLESNFGKALFLSLAWGAVVGGITTFLGGARNILAVSILQKNYNISIGFFTWILYSLPFSATLLVIAYIIIIKFFPPEINSVASAIKKLKHKIAKKGEYTTQEKLLLIIISLVIMGWLFLSSIINISVTALMGGVLIFILNILDWHDIEEYINWGIILMYGGAIVVATTLTDTGAANWLAQKVFTMIPLTPFIFILLFLLITKLLTEGVSNVAAVAIIIPLAFSVGTVININPMAVTLLIALTGGLAFSLPMGAPPNAIAFSSGYLELTEVLKIGIIMNIVSIFVIYLVSSLLWPIIGLNLILP